MYGLEYIFDSKHMTAERKFILTLSWFMAFHMTTALSQDIDVKQDLELLFEVELKAIGEVKPFIESKDIWNMTFSMSRDLIAQGEGVFKGTKIKGTLSWSKLARKYTEHSYSKTLVAGWMETDDGAEIMFEAQGYAVMPDPEKPEIWTYTAALRFEEADKPYQWLNNVTGLWQGEFDISTGIAKYKAYIPKRIKNIP